MSRNMLDMSYVGYDIKLSMFTGAFKKRTVRYSLYILLQFSHRYCLPHDALSPELCRKAVHHE